MTISTKHPAYPRSTPYLFIAPFFVIFSAFFVAPIGFAAWLSLVRWAGVGQPKFIGLANYVELIRTTAFHQVLGNTLWYTVGSLCTIIPFAFILALMLNTKWGRFKDAYRVIYFLPVVTSAIVIGINFSFVYHPQYGLFNWLLGLVGLPPLNWLNSQVWFKPAALLMMVWRWVGYNAVYFLAGLQDISPELNEAAEIDGASWLQRLFRITIPLLRPVILFVLVVEVIGDLQLFEPIYILDQRGGPAQAGMPVAMYLYVVGFMYGRLGYASAVGMALAVVILLISLAQIKWLGAFREY